MHSYDRPPILLEAANVLRERAAAAADDQRERWMVDQSPEHGLIVGSYMPGDVAPDGTCPRVAPATSPIPATTDAPSATRSAWRR